MAILNALSSQFVTVQMAGASIGMGKNYKHGAETVAADTGASAESFRVTRKLLPPGYDAEYKALVKAYNAVRSEFYRMTVPFGMGAVSDGETAKARGPRLLAVSKLVDGSFQTTIDKLQADLAAARELFAGALPGTLARLQYDAALGGTFDIDDYPTPDEVRASFIWKMDGPTPIADGRMLVGMPVSQDWVEAIEHNMESKAAVQAKFAQQSVVQDTLGYVKTLATNLSSLTAWADSNKPGRQPRIFDSLVGNLKHSVEMLRTYAIPDTQEGAALLALADDIEQNLDVDRIDASDLKENIPLARSTASRASAMAAAIEDMPIFS